MPGFVRFIILVSLAFAASCASTEKITEVAPSQLDPLAQQLAQKALNDQIAYQLTESLTMQVGPRLAGSPGDKAAVAWGLRTLEQMGFNNVHTQTFAVPHWVRGETQVQITAPYPVELIATALGGSIGTGDSALDAEVLMTETVETLNALPDSVVQGKIVFFNRRMQATKDGSGYGVAGRERWSGAQNAVKKGALAVVIRPAGTSHHRFAHTGSMGQYDEAIGKIPAASLTNADADILAYAVQNAGDKPVKLRLKMTARYYPDEMSANVIGDIIGSEKPEEIVLLGAHLDSWDLGTGAIDDASGIGIITAAAKIIKDSGIKPKRTIRLVYFGNEEFGLSGAREYARLHKDSPEQHIVGMESDFGAGQIWRFASTLPESMLPLKEQIFKNIQSLGVEMGNNESGGGADLRPMREQGMPTYAFTQDGTKYFNYHHTADDTLDKVDIKDLQQNVAVYVVAVYLTAMSEF
ncbi:MAG: M20/M25/M40 family metallo-hydrolase [Gammaproteobacteria bacterium]|nr:M20/M25/M40 family metallo-hydrolase [Gammaproteobacteria bacterium]